MNGYGKLRRCTDKDGAVLDFFLHLTAAILTVRQLIERAHERHHRTPAPPSDSPRDPYCRWLLN